MTVARMVALGLAACTLALLIGCSSSDDNFLYLNISERAAWSSGNLLSYASFGADGQRYLYRSNSEGGNKFLLTRSANKPDSFIDEGGWHPAFSPDGATIVFSGRRNDGSVSLMLLNTIQGDRAAITNVTDATVAGTDQQPYYRPDGAKIIFSTTKVIGGQGTGGPDIATINPDGTGLEYIVATAEIEQWPVYSPDGSKIAFQRGPSSGPTDIIVRDMASGVETNITTALRRGAGDLTRFEAPCWTTVGGTEYIYLHSNRDTFFDIYRVGVDGSNLERITNTSNSEGFPVMNPDGTRLLFTRDRELWSSAPTGGTEKRVTRRY